MIFFDQVLEEPKRTMLRVILHMFYLSLQYFVFFSWIQIFRIGSEFMAVRIRTIGPRKKKSDPDSKHCFNCELNLYRRWRPT